MYYEVGWEVIRKVVYMIIIIYFDGMCIVICIICIKRIEIINIVVGIERSFVIINEIVLIKKVLDIGWK